MNKKIHFETSWVFSKERLILYLIIFIGSILRLQGVITRSFAFTYDVGRDMLALSGIVHLTHFPFIGATTGLPGIFYGPWWYWLLSPFSFLSGGNPQGIALVMSLIGITTIVLGYLLGRRLGGESMGLTIAALISVSPLLISLSSQIWNPNIAPFFAVLTLLVLEKIYSEKKPGLINYFFLGILLMLSADIEIVYGILFSGGVILSTLFIKRLKFRIEEIISFFIGVLIILSPRILFEIKNHFLMTKSLILFFTSGDSNRGNFFSAVISRLNIFLDQFSQTVAGGNKNIGIGILISMVGILIVLYKIADSNIKKFIITAGIVLLVFFAGVTLFSHDIWPHYLVGLPIFYILILSITLNLLSTRLKQTTLPILFLVVTFLLNFNPVLFTLNLRRPLWEGDASVYRNQLAVIDYIYKEAHGRNFKYVVYTPPLHDYTYQYLFSWYGPAKYHYSPVSQSGLAYFILEPDIENPKRLSDWLNTRVGDGHIISSEKVKGGIIVQTRTSE